jgi:hypothetical protein
MMTELEKELTETVEDLTHQIAVLTEQIAFLTKQIYGSKSEKSKIGEGQISLFEDESPFFKHQSQLKKKPSKRL